MEIEFTIPGEPQGKQRPRMVMSRRSANPIVYTPTKTRKYEELVKYCYFHSCKNGGYKRFQKGAPLEVNIIAYYGIPKNISKNKEKAMLSGKIKPVKKPDADNCVKIILDALNKVAFYDDAAVVKINFEKQYGNNPKVLVKVKGEMSDEP